MIKTLKFFIITLLKYLVLYVVMLYNASNFEKIEITNVPSDAMGNNVLWINKEFIFGSYNLKILLFSSIISLLITAIYSLLKKMSNNQLITMGSIFIVSMLLHYLFFHKLYIYEQFFYDTFNRQKLIFFNLFNYLFVFIVWIFGLFFIEKKSN